MRQAYRWVLGCTIVLAWSAGVSAGDFEGILHMKTARPTAAAESSTTTYYIKGDMARFQSERHDGEGRVVIVDGQKHSMIMLTPEKKVAVEISLEKLGSAAEHMKDTLDNLVVERTGKTETIAGYTCSIWRISDKESKRLEHEVCVAKGFGKSSSFFLDPKRLQQSSQPAWVKQLVNEGGFALRSRMFDHDGKEISRMEVTAIEKKSLDPSLFTVPSDYTRQDMSEMANRMKAMQEQMRQAREQNERGAREGGADAQKDMREMMKQFGEMMKKKQPQSSQ
ncbi:hypothetical protein W02_24290 [Nitrospira sp. KM1]|uniref:DUF4412 domain-containing protein n=1 Tax=Nitrospira sp. KM1 TaxID=1936990 RepID=UPI0013A77B7E|nr:DUF4412 domain-containing protein [Nitrospira sp. KM1]BCA55289.1 hypothetical protein W02_24290 [Nitrospira sp. KM1]